MEKKVYVKRYPRDKREFKDERPHDRRDRRERNERHPDRDDFRRPPRPERPGRPERPRVFHKHLRRPDRIQKTKMFTSKQDLVEYVNSIGDQGHKIDVYKIEDELYKVVIIEEVKEEEIEIEIDEDIEEDIDVEIEEL